MTRQAWVVCANMHVVLAHGRLKLCNPEGAVTAQLVGADDVHCVLKVGPATCT